MCKIVCVAANSAHGFVECDCLAVVSMDSPICRDTPKCLPLPGCHGRKDGRSVPLPVVRPPLLGYVFRFSLGFRGFSLGRV